MATDLVLVAYAGQGLGGEYRLVPVQDSRLALATVRETVPDLILLDLEPSRLDGLALCRSLKADELASHIPILLLTVQVSEPFEIQALEAGADESMAKPLQLPLLKVQLESLLQSRRKLLERFGREIPTQLRELATNPADVYFLRRVRCLVERYLSDCDFDVDALAQKLQMSRRQMFRKLKAVAGCTPNSFIRTMRLERAAQLLAKSQMTVMDITCAMGFFDLKHFRTLFREHFGVLPGDYARRTEEEK